jgi:NifU-like protein involved in Fe-S cluster formation
VYAPAFLDHFRNPRNQGALPDATHRGEAREEACGDRLWIDFKVEAGTIREARFRVQGCPAAIAVGSAAASLLPGRAARADALEDAEVERALGEIPSAKRHALRLLRDALAAAFPGA